MTGLRKQKEYDWKDSNLALFGSDLEKNVKKGAAETEKAWKDAGKTVGMQIWRIVKFKVTHWPKEDYGKFYNGDSYILLNTYKRKDSDELLYDVHFWIGKESTQDEYGTAAYKTVELDTYLDDKPIQHREVQDFESDLFKSYFPTITVMTGGAESGFRHVKKETYKPRLLHFHGTKKHVDVREVVRNQSSLDPSDVFILDMGLMIYQWNGAKANKDERIKAVQYLQDLKSERSGRPKYEVLDDTDTPKTHEFYKALDEKVEEGAKDAASFKAKDPAKELFRLSDASGELKCDQVKKGAMSKKDLDTNDVFILDTKTAMYVWVGQKASEAEKKNAMQYAHNYLQGTDHPLISVTCVLEGNREDTAFEKAIAA